MSESTAVPSAIKRSRRGPLSRGKRLAFAAVAMLLPFVLLGAIEGGLRLAGFGGYPPTITRVAALPSGETLYISDAPGPASFFFNNANQSGSLNQQAFVMPKPAGLTRIIAIGESAMQGFPQPPGLASTSFLKAMLADAWPERRVEVLNLAVTAIASFPAKSILRESLDYAPDLVVIYVGNNEFFGAYGVASLNRAGRTPTVMRWQRAVRSLATVQAATRLLIPAKRQGSLMEIMIGQSFTGAEDPARAAAELTLRTHLEEMIGLCRARGVPVVLCTLPANERDLAPLGKPDLTGLDAAKAKEAEDLLQQWRVKVTTEPVAAVEALNKVVALAPKHAEAHYRLAQALLAQGDAIAAREMFGKALDMDTMPWRPPATTQRAILAAAEAAKGPDLAVADLREAFRAASPDGLVGWNLMDDHVHPSLRGQALVARTIVEAMTRLSGPMAMSKEAAGGLPNDEAYLDRLGDNAFDRYAVQHGMRSLFNIGFFKETNPGAFERFERECKGYEESWSPAMRDVLRKWQDPKTHSGAKIPLGGMMGRQLIRDQRFTQAEQAYSTAARHVPEYTSLSLEYTYFMLECRRRTRGELSAADQATADAAIARGNVLLSFGGGKSPTGLTERYMGRMQQLLGRWAESIPLLNTARERLGGDELVAADLALVEAYLKLNRADDAKKLIENGIKNAGQFSDRYRRMLTLLPK